MLGQLSQCSDWSADWMIRELWSYSWQGLRFLYPIRCLLDWLHPVKPKTLPCCYRIKLTQPLIWWVPGALNPGAQQPWAEADHSPLSSANVTREYSHISTPPRCLHGTHWGKLLHYYSSNSMTFPNPFWHQEFWNWCAILFRVYAHPCTLVLYTIKYVNLGSPAVVHAVHWLFIIASIFTLLLLLLPLMHTHTHKGNTVSLHAIQKQKTHPFMRYTRNIIFVHR